MQQDFTMLKEQELFQNYKAEFMTVFDKKFQEEKAMKEEEKPKQEGQEEEKKGQRQKKQKAPKQVPFGLGTRKVFEFLYKQKTDGKQEDLFSLQNNDFMEILGEALEVKNDSRRVP